MLKNKSQTGKNSKIKILIKLKKTKIVSNLKKSNCDKTQKFKYWGWF